MLLTALLKTWEASDANIKYDAEMVNICNLNVMLQGPSLHCYKDDSEYLHVLTANVNNGGKANKMTEKI